MSQLVKWDYNEFKCMFDSVEAFASAFSTSIRSALKWISRGRINKSILESLTSRLLIFKRENKQAKVAPIKVKVAPIRKPYVKRFTLKNIDDREKFDKLLLDGATLESLAELFGCKINNIKDKLRRRYGNVQIPTITAYLSGDDSGIIALTAKQIYNIEKRLLEPSMLKSLVRMLGYDKASVDLYLLKTYKTAVINDIRQIKASKP